ncbi:peptidyl-prolyl cis-trans isomerase FKBP9 [Hydra vulgaris]|uniref:peptidyl-prolyl cis-trans isomerase FKBP9 n=1 Tax=Hydra vulgaris TaxID=6087 RepID=UPI0002B41607
MSFREMEMKYIAFYLTVGVVICEYEGLDPTGGVSAQNKLKIVDLFKVEDCGMQSQQDDVIHWNYKGMLLDGHVFDSGKFKATLGHFHVITGVDKGMRGLCVGDKRRMIIHSDWAYGDKGIPGTIPPKATLIFDVELTSIERNGKIENLEDKMKKPPVVSKDNKLKIEITHEAKECPLRSQQDDKIEWYYKGTFLDGTEFHSGMFTATLGHGHVITGVDQGMRGMCVGDKRRLIIHSDWAYGDEGRPGTIPPKATLVFDVEMKNIVRTSTKNEL